MRPTEKSERPRKPKRKKKKPNLDDNYSDDDDLPGERDDPYAPEGPEKGSRLKDKKRPRKKRPRDQPENVPKHLPLL